MNIVEHFCSFQQVYGHGVYDEHVSARKAVTILFETTP